MEKLEKLTDTHYGFIDSDGEGLSSDFVRKVKGVQTIVVQNPETIVNVLDDMAERDSVVIPRLANAYTVSDFNPDTQHIRTVEGVEKMFSVYGVQFYYKCPNVE